MRLLIIDDSRALRGLLRRITEPFASEINEASNGREALDRLTAITLPDLALVDWNMPQMNGLEFVTAVRKNRAYDSMRVVMVTTEVNMSQMAKALEAGANEYVMKPFTPETIYEKLQLLGFATEAA